MPHDPYRKLFDEGMSHFELVERPAEADKYFRRILAKDPKHFLANFGHLYVLHYSELTKKNRADRLRFARAVLDNAPNRPRGTMAQLAMRYAANTIAWDLYSSAPKDTKKLNEALRYAEIGARHDPHYDDRLSPVTATKAKVLIALGREEEGYRLVEQVLDEKPRYQPFAEIKQSAAFKRRGTAAAGDRRSMLATIVGADLATERNLDMLVAVDKSNQNKKRAPLGRALVDGLRMQRARGDKKNTVPLPPSVKALLLYDAGLVLTWRPLFDMHKQALRTRGGTLASTTMTEVYGKSSVRKGYRDLKKSAEAEMPALIELAIGSDQRVFVYVAEEARDKSGEYPILRFDDEPCTWITSACLQDEILSLDGGLESVPGAVARKNKAEKAVARWLAREPEQRLVETDDD